MTNSGVTNPSPATELVSTPTVKFALTATPTGTDRVAVTAKLEELATWGPDAAMAAIARSIANGWSGIFRADGAKGTPAPTKPPIAKATDDEMRSFRAWWNGLDSDQREAWAASIGVGVSVVDQAVQWQRVPAAWIERRKDGAA